MKRRFSYDNNDFTHHNYKNVNNKNLAKKKGSKNWCRVLPEICNSEEMTSDQFLKELCKNLHEPNEILICELYY